MMIIPHLPRRAFHLLTPATLVLVLVCVLLLPPLGGCGRPAVRVPPTDTKYQAVLLTTGQLYFGEVGGLDGNYLRLNNVFYIQGRVDSETKQAKPILVKRGNEWHGPTFMYINTSHILIVEPVSPQSRLAELIKEADAAK